MAKIVLKMRSVRARSHAAAGMPRAERMGYQKRERKSGGACGRVRRDKHIIYPLRAKEQQGFRSRPQR